MEQNNDVPYQITDIRSATHYPDNAPPVQGYRADFVTKKKIRSHVTVPRSEHVDHDIHDAISKEASMLDNALTMEPRSG